MDGISCTTNKPEVTLIQVLQSWDDKISDFDNCWTTVRTHPKDR